MKGYSILFVIIISIVLAIACNKEQYNYLEKTKNPNEIISIENRLAKVFNMYLGLFSNKIQSRKEASPIYRSQELIAVQIWPRRGDEYWLYICWLQEDRPEDLLSQEVWNFKKKDRETMEIVMYDLPNKGDFAEDWRKKEPLANLHAEELIYYDGCTVTITRENTNQFRLQGEPCKRELSDVIKYIEVNGIITPEYIHLFNRMLDKEKKEVFSYKKGLQFERQPKIFPKYLEED